jgi:c-di-GMP-binding flagellar brake protein YcgR
MSGQVVRNRPEIIALLSRLARERVALTAHWEGEALPAPSTRLLAVNPDFEEMVFDCFPEPLANRRAVDALQVNFHCELDGVEIHFYAECGEVTVHDGHPAIRMRLPSQLLRMQRREHFRVPAAIPCEVVLAGERTRVLEMRVADLSIGGLRLVCEQELEVVPGQTLGTCRLKLGDEGVLAIPVEVRNAYTVPMPKGGMQTRMGCQFKALPPAAEMQLARFIGKLERKTLCKA